MEPWKRADRGTGGAAERRVQTLRRDDRGGSRAWTPAQLRPYIDWVCERFGIERILYGGDWPVSELAGDYLQWLTTLEQATADFSEGERRNLFRDNADAHLSSMTSERLAREGYSVAALRRLARRELPRMLFDMVDGGAGDENHAAPQRARAGGDRVRAEDAGRAQRGAIRASSCSAPGCLRRC